MSCSKPLAPFVCDSLYYLSRDQLERFSIVCRPLKNFINQYLHSKPYRVFDQLWIRGGSYALFHNRVQWHPNREDYNVQQFLATQKCSIERTEDDPSYYSFTGMVPYFGSTIRIIEMKIVVTGDYTYSLGYIAEMESIAYLWRDGDIFIDHANYGVGIDSRIDVKDLHLVLNSPTILQCQNLFMINTHFSFKDYKILYTLKAIVIYHVVEDEIDLWQQYWQQFLEQPGVKPLVIFRILPRENVINLLDRLTKAFSSAVSPNAFKIIFVQDNEDLTEFRDTNYARREKLELKKGVPVEYQHEISDTDIGYTLERCSI